MGGCNLHETGLGPELWFGIALFGLASLATFWLGGFTIDPTSLIPPVLQTVACLALAGLCFRLRDCSRLSDRSRWMSARLGFGLASFIQSAAITSSAMLMTFVAATAKRPLVDAQLLQIDEMLGYSWKAYADLVQAHPALSNVIVIAYALILPEPLIVLAVLAGTGRFRRLERYILASILSLLLTMGLFALFPATTAWTHLGLTDARVAAFQFLPVSGDGWIRDLTELRAGGGRVFAEFRLSALAAFPSYHCVAAILFVWATWPIRRLRLAMVFMNAAMIASAPIIGGHYLTDLVGGLAVALVSITVADRLYAWRLAARCGRKADTAPVNAQLRPISIGA